MLKVWRKVSRCVTRCVLPLVFLMGPFIADAQCGNMGTSVAVDGAGNIYVTGTITRWADFDPGLAAVWCGVSNPVEYPGGETWSMGYLAKYGSDRSLNWVVQLTGNASQWLNDVAVGSDGSVYVVGFSQYATSFGNTALNPLVMSAFLAKVDPQNGSTVWCTQFDNLDLAATGSVGENIALETSIDGTTTGVVISGWSRPANPNFGDAPFIARYDLVGTLSWAEGLGATGYASISDLAADSSGVYATGSFRKTLDFGLDEHGVLLTKTTADEWISDGFVVKLSHMPSDSGSAPVWEWAIQYPRIGVAAVAVDGDSLYVSGDDVPDDYDIEFIDKLAATTGEGVWHKLCRNATARDIVARDNFLYLTGTFSGTVDFDLSDSSTKNLTTSPSSNAAREAFLWKMDSTGALEWVGQIGGHGSYNNSQGIGIAVDGYGNVVTTGWFSGSPADFDPSGAGNPNFQLIRLGRGDAFVSKVDPDMIPQWVFQIGSRDLFADNGQKAAGIDYTESGSGWKNGISGGYTGDFRTHAKGSGTNKATWTVSGLPGGTYEVFATWVPNSKNATDAKFTVNGVVVTINQRLSPHSDNDPNSIILNSTSETGATTRWKSLGRFVAGADGKIAVILNDKANGIVVADAIRVLIYNPLP